MRESVQVQALEFQKGGYSLAEQIRVVGTCSLLMGVHGAGLNLAISMPRPATLEIKGAGIANANGPNLMSALGGCYHHADIVQGHRIRPDDLLKHALAAMAECGARRGRHLPAQK